MELSIVSCHAVYFVCIFNIRWKKQDTRSSMAIVPWSRV